jgi:hypothetical protein
MLLDLFEHDPTKDGDNRSCTALETNVLHPISVIR